MKTLIPGAAALALQLVAAAQASAHAFLRTADPAVGSVVGTPPKQVSIDFTEAVEPLFSTVAVTDAAGTRVDAGKPHLAGRDDRLAVALEPLAPGVYTVSWHATATDTHRTEGRFSFTVR